MSIGQKEGIVLLQQQQEIQMEIWQFHFRFGALAYIGRWEKPSFEKKCPPPIAGKGIPLRRGKPSIEERNEAMDIFHTHSHPRWMFNLLTMSTNLHISGNGEWPAWRSDVVVEVEEIGFDTFSGGGRAASSKPSILDCQVISQTPNKRILLCV